MPATRKLSPILAAAAAAAVLAGCGTADLYKQMVETIEPVPGGNAWLCHVVWPWDNTPARVRERAYELAERYCVDEKKGWFRPVEIATAKGPGGNGTEVAFVFNCVPVVKAPPKIVDPDDEERSDRKFDSPLYN